MEFDSEAFCFKEWINETCRQKPLDEALDRYIARLELQLNLQCETVESEIVATTSKLSSRIPFVLQEAEKIQSEMEELRETLGTTVSLLRERSAKAKTSVSDLRDLHRMKSNMQSACDCLKEATELSELFVRVDAVFGSGDISAMAKMITTMKRSLKLVGNVPEFENGKEKLNALEESLVVSIESKLFAAISDRLDDEVKRLSAILIELEHEASLEKVYIEAKKHEMREMIRSSTQSFVDAIDPKNVIECVIQWHDTILEKLRGEYDTCAVLFPSHGHRLVEHFVKSLFSEWNPVLESVLRKMESLLLTGKIQKEILEFTNAMKEMLKGKMDEEELRSMVECVFVPIENEIQRFALIEKKILLEAINPIASQSVSISVMERSVDSIVRLAESAIDDCLALTEGTELETLSAQIEFALSKCVSTMTSSLKTIRAKALSESSTEDVSMLSSVLQLLKLAMAIERNVDLVAKKFNEAKIDVQNRLRNSSPFDHVQTRLSKFQPKARSLRAFLEREDWQGKITIQQTIDGFRAASEALVFDTLMHKPRQLFKDFNQMEEWRKESTESDPTLELPHFNAYPLHYVSAFSEYLMLVPQQLEALVSVEPEADDFILDREEELASTLLNKVIDGCCDLYVDEILSLGVLSVSGSVQLACDLQYFTNVLSAMGSALPSPLATVSEAIQTPIAELKKRIDASERDSNRQSILLSILKMRRSA